MHNEDFNDIVTWGEKGDSIIILKVHLHSINFLVNCLG